MTSSPAGAPAGSLRRTLRAGHIIGGAVALIVGLLMLIWPDKTAIAFTVVLAVYALVAGIVYIGIGIASKEMSGWSRAGQILAGVLFVVTAVIAFANPATSALTFAYVTVVFIGVSWIFEGVAALTLLPQATSKGWTVFHAIVSLLGGAALLIAPFTGIALMWLWFAVTLIVLGVVQVVRGVRA